MITLESLNVLNTQELAYLYACCRNEFDKNGYVYFGFDVLKIFNKETIIDILIKYTSILSENDKDLPEKIISKLEDIY